MCPNVIEKINSKNSIGSGNTCVIIDVFDDIKTPYYFECYDDSDDYINFDPNDPSLSFTPPPCPRWERQLNFDYNITRTSSVTNIPWATFFIFDNQPCGPETEFKFEFYRAMGLFGSQFPSQTNKIVQDMQRPNLLYEGKGRIQRIRIGLLKYAYVRITPRISPENVTDAAQWDEMPFIRGIPLNQGVFRSHNSPDNNWQPENQGNYIDLHWHEVDTEVCSSTQSNSVSYNVGGAVQFGKGDKTSGSLSWGVTSNSQWSYTINAVADVNLGTFQLSYCDEPTIDAPSWGLYRNSIGSVNNSAALYSITHYKN